MQTVDDSGEGEAMARASADDDDPEAVGKDASGGSEAPRPPGRAASGAGLVEAAGPEGCDSDERRVWRGGAEKRLLAQRELAVASREHDPAPIKVLPGRGWSVLGVSAALGACALVQLSPDPAVGHAVVALVFLTWAAIKVHAVISYSQAAPVGMDDDHDPSSVSLVAASVVSFQKKESVSCLHRAFRRYYLLDQSVSVVPRAVAWFCFVAMVLIATFRFQQWLRPVACFSQSCCVAAEAVGWDMSLVECHDDIISSSLYELKLPEHGCSGLMADDMKALCHAASDIGWWERGYALWTLSLAWLIMHSLKVICLACVPLPDKPTKWINDPDFLGRIGAVIPCHQSESEIASTCRSIMRYLPPQNIVVADNANSEQPPDETRAAVKAVHPDIAYIYNPRGLKTLALYNGMMHLPAHVEYLLHLDDDTVLPEDMVFDEEWFADPSVAEVTFPIFAREVNLLTSCIGFIFKVNAHVGYFKNFTSGTSLWAPGVIGLVRRSAFMKVLPDHVFLPFGEDAFHGTLLLANNQKIKRDARCSVITFAPEVFFTPCASSSREQGYGATSLFKQRAQRWMVTQLRRMSWTFLLLFTFRAGTLWGNIWFRITTVRTPIMTLVLLLATPMAATTVLHHGLDVWIPFLSKVLIVYYVVNVIQLSIINYGMWRHRPDFQVRWTTVLFTPVLKMFVTFICHPVGHTLSLIYWIPFVPSRVHVFTHSNGSRQSSQPSLVA